MHQFVFARPESTQLIAEAHCSMVRMLTDIGPVEVAFRWNVKVSGTLAARYQSPPLITCDTVQVVTVGCSRSAFACASSPRVAVRFMVVVFSWSFRIWLRPVSDSFCVVRERMVAWLLE